MPKQNQTSQDVATRVQQEAIASLNANNSTTLHFGELNSNWSKWGYAEAPIQYRNASGAPIDSKYKAILKDGQLRAILSKRYALYPNEEALNVVEKLANERGLTRHDNYQSRGGNVLYATFLSQKELIVTKDDAVQVGFYVMNSIDGSVPFGFGVFTYRLVCTNGMMHRYDEIKVEARHLANLENFITNVGTRIDNVLRQAEQIIPTYQRMVKQQLTKTQVDELAEILPRKYLPSSVETVTDSKTGEETVELVRPQTVWDAYNDITDNVWHNQKVDVRTKEKHTSEAHRILVR